MSTSSPSGPRCGWPLIAPLVAVALLMPGCLPGESEEAADAGPVAPTGGTQATGGTQPDAGGLQACTVDADCAVPGAFCGGGFCRELPGGECTTDRDCPEGTLCVGRACVRDAVRCDTDRDCPDPATTCENGTCVTPTAGCTTDDECPRGEICEGGACRPAPAGCETDDVCGPGRRCLDGTCVDDAPACDEDADCADGSGCVDGVCVPTGDCQGDRDCGPGERCEAGACVPATPGCTDDAECGAGEICRDGACVPDLPPCGADTDCPGTLVCREGLCVPDEAECVADGDCARGETCEAGACVPVEPGCGPGAECPPNSRCEDGVCVLVDPGCGADADCDVGERCVSGVCEAASPECVVDGDCAADEICRQGACVADLPDCVADADCAPGQICSNNACVAAPDECRVDADCPAGEVCTRGACVAPPPECVADRDCPAGETCRAGVCVGGPAACTGDLGCPLGQLCLAGVCRVPGAAPAPVRCNPRAVDPGCPDTQLCVPSQACPLDAANCAGVCAPSTCDACLTGDACGDQLSSCIPGYPAAFCVSAGVAGEGEGCDLDGAIHCRAGLTCIGGQCAAPCGGAACGAASRECAAGLSCVDFDHLNGDAPFPLCVDDCDLLGQRGCAAGQACSYATARPDTLAVIGLCSDSAPSGRLVQGQACVQRDDAYWGNCRSDHFCAFGVDPDGAQCFGVCTVEDQRNCTGLSRCVIGAIDGRLPVGVCLGECEVFDGGCGGGQVCRYAGIGKSPQNEDVFTGLCETSAGTLMVDDYCDFAADGSSDCPTGTLCADTGDFFGSTCVQLCDASPGSPNGCPEGRNCTTGVLGADRPEGASQNLGACL